jgi:hypothetical protein
MKITNFNVNNIERRLMNLPNRLGEAQPTSSACEKPRPRTRTFQRKQSGRRVIMRYGAAAPDEPEPQPVTMRWLEN